VPAGDIDRQRRLMGAAPQHGAQQQIALSRDSLETTVNIINMETCSTNNLRELNLSWEDVTAAAVAAEDRQLCGPLHDVCGMNQRQT